VAWNSTISGINIFGGGYGDVNGPEEPFLDVAGQARGFDISQNSWGATPFYLPETSLSGGGFTAGLAGVYETLSAQGRGGLGTIITQAAGNDNLDANGDGVNASRHTITVAATDSAGFAADYSNFGASILVTAPAAEVTTDLSGAAGDNDTNDLDNFGGTSAATPVVSGVVALMLEANTRLGWRDVQNILAASATLTGSELGDSTPDATEEGVWTINGAGNWNGGGMHVHTNYGYGMVNAYNAVRMAEVWSLLYPTPATSANERSVGSSVFSGSLLLPDATPAGRQILLTVTEAVGIEHVALHLDIEASYIGDLRVVLVSPEGTEVVVALEQGIASVVDGTWVYGIESLRGELSAGTWELRVSDMFSGDDVRITGAALEIYGGAVSANDVHHITAEFQAMAAQDSARRTITDSNGGTDWLSFATVAGHVELTLIGGRSFAVNGGGLGHAGHRHPDREHRDRRRQ
jgi:subtilisin-like proprotein convertase family protein